MLVEPEHEGVAELLGVYALDAVEPDERSLVEQHLSECPRCRSEVDALRQVAADLAVAEGLEGEQPPPEVWTRIAARTGIRDAPPLAAPERATAGAPAGVIRVDAARWRARRPLARLGLVVAGVAAAAIAALAFSLVQANGRVHDLQSALAGHGTQAAVHAALSSPDHRVTDLRTSGGRVLAELVVQRNGVGYVVRSTMAKLPATQTYQLWASIHGRPISLGLLGRDPAPGAAFSVGPGAAGVRELMVTVEPGGGVPTPDHAPIATAPLSPA